MDRFRAMEVFVRVGELGSFTRAAEGLRLPRASVTAAVQELEGRLGVQQSPRGRLRVDVPARAGRHLLTPALPEFVDRYPELVVELGSGDRPVDLLGESVDCVIRGGDVHDEALVGRRLGELPVITCAAPRYLAAHGVPAHPDALARHVFVGYFSARTGRVFEVDFARGGEERSFRPRHVVAANDADAWIAAAVAGLGLIQVPCDVGTRCGRATSTSRRACGCSSSGSWGCTRRSAGRRSARRRRRARRESGASGPARA